MWAIVMWCFQEDEDARPTFKEVRNRLMEVGGAMAGARGAYVEKFPERVFHWIFGGFHDLNVFFVVFVHTRAWRPSKIRIRNSPPPGARVAAGGRGRFSTALTHSHFFVE
jgi:hypothetical protein